MKSGMCFLPVTFEGMEQGISRVVLELDEVAAIIQVILVFVAHVYIIAPILANA